MNKTFLTIGGLLLVLVVALFIFNSRKSLSPVSQLEKGLNQSSNSAGGKRKVSLRSLLSGDRSLSCDVSVAAPENGTMTGKIYISGQKMRGDFVAKVEGREVQSYTVSDGSYSYNWSSLTSQGVKVRTDKTASSGSKNEGADLDREMDVDCQEWSADNSKFEIPSAIQFIEAGSSQSGGVTPVLPNTSGSTPDPNSVCDNLTNTEAKAACKAALGN